MPRPHRREVLKIGALGASLSLGRYLQWAEAGQVDSSTERAGILVFLRGGPSHQDMFDLKPDAPAEVRGEFRPMATKVPGMEICEHLPRLAASAEQYAILRGVSHNLAAHDLGSRYLLTGNRPMPLLRHPTYGAVVSRELPCAADVPSYVAIDEDPEGPGYLGVEYGALSTGEKPRDGQPFSVRGITLDEGMSIEELGRRRKLADDVDDGFRAFDRQVASGASTLARRAYDIIRSPRTRQAFDLNRESPRIAARFGKHEFGLSLLLAARLIETGVRFVTVFLDGWDTHQKNFVELKSRLLPQFDEGLSALFSTLSERGLLATTSVLVTGEFGRTPKINGTAGRDHWARAMFALLAGAGTTGGQVIGASDATAAEPAGTVITPDDLAATFYHTLGIDPHREYHTDSGRPLQLIRDGQVLAAFR